MSKPKRPLDSDQHRLIDGLCDRFDVNPSAGLTEVADLIRSAPDHLQDAVARALLVRYFKRQLARGETIDERGARNFGVGPDVVQRAKAAAQAEFQEETRSHRAAFVPTQFDRNRFQFLEPLGRGGFGRVGKYRDQLLERDVAIKLSRDPDDKQFGPALDEVRQTCRVSSSRVIQIHEVGLLWDDNPFLCNGHTCRHTPDYRPAIVMEFAQRGRLSDGLKNGEPYHIHNIARHFPVIAQGVGDVHDATLVHLDLKPGNILFGADAQARLADFGLARAWLNAAPERLGGTQAWMAPELLRNYLADQRTTPDRMFDIWALGVIFYEMLTGQHPFTMHGSDWQKRILNPSSVLPVGDVLPRLSPEWDRFISGCLQEKPEKRFTKHQRTARCLQRGSRTSDWPALVSWGRSN